MVLLATIGLNMYLFVRVPKGFFPQQDNGRMMGAIQADQDTSFQAMNSILLRMIDIVKADPAVDNVLGFTGGGGGTTTNTARMFISLKPLDAAQNQRRPRHRAPAPQAGPSPRRDPVSAGRRRTSASAGRSPTPSISSPCAATTWPT